MTSTDHESLARTWGLARVGARPPLLVYLRELWARRVFAVTLARFRIQSTVSDNRLGLGWVVLQPLLNAALYGAVFGSILSANTRPTNFSRF